MQPFEYFAPQTLSEAIAILGHEQEGAYPIAGGTDLLLKMKAGRLAPRVVVNLKRVAALRGRTYNGHLTLGALTTLEEIRLSPLVRAHYPALSAAAATMASVQVRHLATLGGNLCNAAPSADLAPILMALGAMAHIAGPAGERQVSLDAFFTGPGRTVLAPGELLVSVALPALRGGSLYLKQAPRACMDIAVVGVGLALELEDDACRRARIVLGAVAPTPLRATGAEAELAGGDLSPERIARAARIAAHEAQPIDDVRGSAWYRRQMVEVLTRRGLTHLAAARSGDTNPAGWTVPVADRPDNDASV
jgi:carbon-monoxide dehydrogenase medium subunit